MLGQRVRTGLLPYVARLHVEWYTQAPGELHRRVPGTLVFADISGFTALTERLSRKGLLPVKWNGCKSHPAQKLTLLRLMTRYGRMCWFILIHRR